MTLQIASLSASHVSPKLARHLPNMYWVHQSCVSF